jgi:carbamate kinase
MEVIEQTARRSVAVVDAADPAFETRRVSDGDRSYRWVLPPPEPVDAVEAAKSPQLVAPNTLVSASQPCSRS